MNTLNKLLARWGLKLTRTDQVQIFPDLKPHILLAQAENEELREQIKELKRKLAARTAGEWYWRKQAKSAREVIE